MGRDSGSFWEGLGGVLAFFFVFAHFEVFLNIFTHSSTFKVFLRILAYVCAVLCHVKAPSDASAASVARLCCAVPCQSAKRRERSEHREAPGLFAVFRYFLLFLIVFGCFVIVWAVFGCPANFQIFCLSFACFYYAHVSSRFPFLAKTGRSTRIAWWI